MGRFRTLIPVWIHQWLRNYAQSLKQYGRGALLFFKVICQIARSHGSKNRRIWPKLGVSGLWLQFEFTNGYEMMQKAWCSMEEVPYCFSRSSVKLQGHTANKIVHLTQIRRSVAKRCIEYWSARLLTPHQTMIFRERTFNNVYRKHSNCFTLTIYGWLPVKRFAISPHI